MDMRLCRVFGLVSAIVLLGATTPLLAQTVIDFDDVSDGTVVETQYQGQGVTLSCLGNCSGSSVVAEATSFVTSAPNVVVPQVGTINGCFSESDGIVRATFAPMASQVTIDTIADNGFDPAFLNAYDSTDTLIDSDTNSGTQGSGNADTLSVVGAIAYVEFSGQGGDTACFDDLSFVAQQVPTMPGVALMLLTLALLGVGCWMFRPAA